MKILVVGGTGTVGSEVVRQLKSREEQVFVLTRSPDHASKLPAGVTIETGFDYKQMTWDKTTSASDKTG